LSEVAHAFGAPLEPRSVSFWQRQNNRLQEEPQFDLAEVQGQQEARWALEIAAAGAHHILLQGPPGAGKTMLAQRLPTILADMEPQTALKNAAIRTLLDSVDTNTQLLARPTFQAPHLSATATALIGCGSGIIRPGAVYRAHGGVLFLDEAAEFNRD